MSNSINWGKIYSSSYWGTGITNTIHWGKVYVDLLVTSVSEIPNLLSTITGRATTTENLVYTEAKLTEIESDGLLEKASILLTPTSYGTGVVNAIKPKSAPFADFAFARSSSATRINSNGIIEDVLTDIPRIDYSTGVGVLKLEHSDTNIFKHSENFSSTYWKSNNGSVSEEPSGFFDLRPSAKSIKYTSTIADENEIFTQQNESITSVNTEYTDSFYVKSNTADFFHIFCAPSVLFSSTDLLVIDNSTKQVVNTASFMSDVVVEDVGNGWVFVSYTYTALFATSVFHKVYASSSSSDRTAGLPIGDSLYMTCVEHGEGLRSSYIPTNGVSTTRAADQGLVSSNLSSLINSEEGVIYIEASVFTNTGSNRNIGLSDGTNNNSAKIMLTSVGHIQVTCRNNSTGSVVKTSLTYSPPLGLTDFNKIAFKYSPNGFAIWLNGVEVKSNNSGNVPSFGVLDRINFDRGDTFSFYEGNVKAVAVFKEALTDTELQNLTS